MKKIVFTFGRMNPPTIGHQKLVDKVNAVAKSNGADARVYLSHTQNAKKDPLDYTAKYNLAKKAFGPTVFKSRSKTVIQILQELEKGGYTDIIMVAGSDRVPEFKSLLTKYNGKDYNFDSIDVVSAGERDPDAEGVEGMSASKLRALAKQGDFNTFKTGLPKKLNDADAKKIYDTIRSVITEEALEEDRKPLSIQQRFQRARLLKRLAPKLARMRKLKAKRVADSKTIQTRALKVARNIIRKKVAGERGAQYKELSPSEKITIDKLVAKKSAMIQKMAKKLLPKVRKAEIERAKQARAPKEESFDIDALFEATVAQDPTIKDREGTQPKKYFSGLAPSTKEKRDAAFKTGKKASDDDPKAYKPAPGDAEAETKPSKHTKKYKQMFGEAEFSPNTDRVKKQIEREKQQDAQKHDRMRDSALKQDAALKARTTKPKATTNTEEYELSEDATAALQKKADKSGIPLGILRQVYNRGMAAWKTGHRPGATQQQWGFARVNSFVTKSKGTWGGADSDLASKVRGTKKELVNEDVGTVKHHQFQKTFKHAMKHAQIHQDIDVDGDVDALEKLVPDEVTGAEKNAKMIQKHYKQKLAKEKEHTRVGVAFESVELDEKCWDGYKQVGMKKKGDKMVPDCVPEASSPAQQAAIAISKKKKLNAMLGIPKAYPTTPIGEQGLEEMPRWLLEPLSKITHKKGYKMAKKVLTDVLDRKKREAGKKGLQHSIEYYAAQVAKQFDGVDARTLADMVNEEVKMDPPQVGTDKTTKRFKQMTPGQTDKPIDVTPSDLVPPPIDFKDLVGKKKVVNESFETPKSAGVGHTMYATEFMKIQGAFAHHPDVEAKLAEQEACCDDCEDYFDHIVEESEYQGRKVTLNDPFRTPKGPKKFSVYVKNDKGNVVKVNFGDPNMEIKRDDPESRKNFRARHNCDNPGPKWKARYWSCYQWRSGSKVDN